MQGVKVWAKAFELWQDREGKAPGGAALGMPAL